MQPTAIQHTIGIHVKGSGNGVANDRHNMVMAESRLQWSSDSTLGASPTLAENGKRMLKHHQVSKKSGTVGGSSKIEYIFSSTTITTTCTTTTTVNPKLAMRAPLAHRLPVVWAPSPRPTGWTRSVRKLF